MIAGGTLDDRTWLRPSAQIYSAGTQRQLGGEMGSVPTWRSG
jgi:hypothetical protein